MTQRTKDICIAVVQILSFLCTLLIFFVYAPWQGAEPIADVPADVLASLPVGCPAFIVNHGKYVCFWYGTRTQNPTGYWFCTVLFFSSLAITVSIRLAKRGIYSPLHRDPPSQR